MHSIPMFQPRLKDKECQLFELIFIPNLVQ